MRIKSFLPGTFIFQTSLRPQDIEFIVLDKMPEPGFSPASRSYADYFGEADDTCFVIRGISQSNRPPRPVARAQMELMPQGGTRVIVRSGFAWRMKLFLGIAAFMIAQMTCTLITQTINIAEYLSHIGLLILTGLGFIVYFLYRFPVGL